MKNFTFLLKPLILVLGMLLSANAFSQVTLFSYDFEPSIEGWTIGGTDASRVNNGTWSCGGSYTLRSLGNNTSQNRLTSPVLDLTGNSSVDISFCHKADKVDNNEGFILEFYDGTSWVLLQTYHKKLEFTTRGSTKPHNFTFNVDGAAYTLSASSQFRFSSDCNEAAESNYFDDVLIEGYQLAPEIDIFGNGNEITSGDVTPAASDDTEYGNISLSVPTVHTFAIENNGNTTLNISSVTLGGVNPGDFSISASPSATVAASGSTTFDVTFTSTVLGPRSAIVTIANDDSDESTYTFTVQGTATPPQPEINVQGNGTDIADGATLTSTADDTDFGNVNQGSSLANTFTIQNPGTAILTIGSTVTLATGTDFTVTTQPATTSITAGGGSTPFIITFTPLSSGDFTDVVTITSDDSDESPYTFAISGSSYLVEAGGSWSYLDDNSNQGTAWQTADVSPTGANWATGNAQLGYGDGDEITVINSSANMGYFRKSFTASAGDVANTTLNLNAIRDDGMVVYINGTEIWRDNMPTGTILYNTWAAGVVGDETAWVSINIANILVVGNNEIAVEVHQESSGSSDISFDFFMYTSNDYIFIEPTQPDNDFDTVADYKDTDDDNDGIPDLIEGCHSGQFDDLNSDPYGSGSEESILGDFPFTQTLDDGNTIDYSITGTFNAITSYDAGDHGWSIRTRGSTSDPTYGTITFDFGTNVENLSFRLVDFDENETYTVDAYDDTNTLIDLISNVNIYFLGSYLQQTGNTVTDSTNGLSGNNNGEDISSDQYGTAYFYFPNVSVSKVVFTVDQPDGSSIRIAALEYCNQDTDGDTIEDYHDSDSDNDAIPDLVEGGGTDIDGNGIIDNLTDTDGDGIADILDADASNYNAQESTKLLPYLDFDGDGVYNNLDLDSDNDGIADIIEIGEKDANGDGQIDGFTDSNLDGYHDSYDGITSKLITGSDAGADGFPDSYPNANADSRGFANFMDLDSDDDGITDNTEAQATGSYITYTTVDTDGDGISNIFEALVGFGGAGLTPVDSDGDGAPDYLDTDSDNAEENDLIEGHDTNGDGVVDGSDSPSAGTGLFTGTDSDNDGLDNGFDNNDVAFNVTNGSLQATSHPIVDGGSDRDWRSTVAAIDFDGTDDHIDYGDEHEFTSAFSLEAWILQETTVTTGTIMAKSNNKSGNQKGYRLVLNNSYPNLKWYDNSSTLIVDITSPYAISNNRWYHVAATYDGTTAKLFIDGIEVVATSAPAGPPAYSTEKFLIGATYDSDTPTSPKKYFNGFIDEIRIWNVALSSNQMREMMNQEIEESPTDLGSGSLIRGSVIPLDISGELLWDDLYGYYPLTNDSADDKSRFTKNGSPRNITTTELQTAPLPYTTKADGVWTDNTGTTPWTLGDTVWDEPNGLGVDGTPIDWNIVVSSHNVSSGNKDITVLGLITDTTGTELTMADPSDPQDETNSGQGLRVTNYLEMNGDIDLVGESQLVQDTGSILALTSAGTLERDQQGTRDLFTYNYWSSPVGESNFSSNNNSYTLTNTVKDGTNSELPATINFLTSGYNGSTGPPINIADYWIWKYANNVANDYSQWEHVRSTGSILAGEGFTMKGVADTDGLITLKQNYVFKGKPNNGDISLSISAGSQYLVGNPYPSALDANEFILDNLSISDGGRNSVNVINGVLLFWDHFASSTHVLADYQGGYATYTLMGGAAAISNDARIDATLEVGTKIPERYIPVGQGFFVSAILNTNIIGDFNDPDIDFSVDGGPILFKNSQRVFKLEAVTNTNSGSVFLRSSSNTKSETEIEDVDTRQKIRLMFNSSNGYHRPLLVGVDENATNNFDLGYDAPLAGNNKEDMFWTFNNTDFVIQAVNNFEKEQVLSLGTRIEKEGLATLKIETLENISDDLQIFVHDKDLDIYHDLRASDFEVYLTPGEYLERFEITFFNSLILSNDNIESEFTSLQTYYSNENGSIIIHNPNLLNIESIEMYNILGQSILRSNKAFTENYKEIKTNPLSVGTYIIKLKTQNGIVSKKVLVQ